MDYYVVLVFAAFLILMCFTGYVPVSSVAAHVPKYQGKLSIYSVNIDMFYDVIDDLGFIEENITFNEAPTGIVKASVPLIPPPSENSRLEIVNVEYPPQKEKVYLIYSYVEENSSLTILFNATQTLIIRYTVYNYLDEIGLGVYALELDTSSYSFAAKFYAKVRIIGNYTVQVFPSEHAKVTSTNDVSILEAFRPATYILIISEKTSPSPTTTTPVPSPPTTTYFPWEPILLIMVVAAASLLGYYMYRKRHTRIIVETVPTGDLLSDDTVRDILVAVGNAGEEGVKQSDLVRLTRRPKSTISRRVKRLAEEGYIEVIRKGKYNIIRLTDKGKQVYSDLKNTGETLQ